MNGDTLATRWLARVVVVRPGEMRALRGRSRISSACSRATMCCGRCATKWASRAASKICSGCSRQLFSSCLQPYLLFGAIVARLPRKRFVPLVYHFFVLNIAIFWLLLTSTSKESSLRAIFFVWISVFNLFAVSVFWSFMADLYRQRTGQALVRFHRRGRVGRSARRACHNGRAGRAAGPRKPSHHCSCAARSWRCCARIVSRRPPLSLPSAQRRSAETPRE